VNTAWKHDLHEGPKVTVSLRNDDRRSNVQKSGAGSSGSKLTVSNLHYNVTANDLKVLMRSHDGGADGS
jgi:hypothetical protein